VFGPEEINVDSFCFYFLGIKMWGTGGVDQVVEHLPTRCEALSSSPVPPKKNSREMCT
jgi:hypothetical protein